MKLSDRNKTNSQVSVSYGPIFITTSQRGVCVLINILCGTRVSKTNQIKESIELMMSTARMAEQTSKNKQTPLWELKRKQVLCESVMSNC